MRVAIAQPELDYDSPSTNVPRLAGYVQAAAACAADVIVLPECPRLGWLARTTEELAETVPGPYTAQLSSWATTHRISIVSGIEERSGGHVHNSAVLVDPNGRLLLHHRKIDELDIGLNLYQPGDRLAVGQLDGITVGVSICADSWHEQVVPTLALMGATMIFSPCAWAIESGREDENTAWLENRYLTHAAKHGMTFFAANSVGSIEYGPWAGRALHGDSMAVGPAGVLARGRRREADLLIVDLS